MLREFEEGSPVYYTLNAGLRSLGSKGSCNLYLQDPSRVQKFGGVVICAQFTSVL
jgi:hypothetical protein